MENLKNVKTEVKRIHGNLYEIVKVLDEKGSVVQTINIPLKVELKIKDILQIIVGASILAVPVAFTQEVWDMGGELAWRRIFADPGSSSNLFGLLLTGIDTLFSTKGLAALGSYALLNLFFAFHFYRRYKRILNRAVQKTTDSLKAGLVEVWEEKFNALLEDLKRFRAGIRAQISTISDLKQGRRIE